MSSTHINPASGYTPHPHPGTTQKQRACPDSAHTLLSRSCHSNHAGAQCSSSSRLISSTPWAAAPRPSAAAVAAAAAPAAAQTSITITTPDDWHLHVRDGDNMRSVVPHTAAHFARAIIMPNLVPPVTNVKLVSSWGVGVSHMHEHSTAWHQESEASCTDEQLCIRSPSLH